MGFRLGSKGRSSGSHRGLKGRKKRHARLVVTQHEKRGLIKGRLGERGGSSIQEEQSATKREKVFNIRIPREKEMK